MQDCLSSLNSSLPEWDKVKWKSIMNAEFMSSEESVPEDPKAFKKQSLPWRSAKVAIAWTIPERNKGLLKAPVRGTLVLCHVRNPLIQLPQRRFPPGVCSLSKISAS